MLKEVSRDDSALVSITMATRHTSLAASVPLAFSKSVGLSHSRALRLLSSSHLATGPYTRHSVRYLVSQVKFLTPIILMKTFPKFFCSLDSLLDAMSDDVMVIDVPIKLGISYQR